MKTIRLSLLVLLLSLTSLLSAGQNHSTTIRVQAMEMGNAAIRNDFNTFVKFMHPDVVAFAGGKEAMRFKMDSAYGMMKQFGVTFKRYWIGKPEAVVKHGKQLQALLPQTTVMKTGFGDLQAETTMLAISEDGGKNWWFVDTNVYGAEKLKNILPDLSPKLVLPPRTKPKLIPPPKASKGT